MHFWLISIYLFVCDYIMIFRFIFSSHLTLFITCREYFLVKIGFCALLEFITSSPSMIVTSVLISIDVSATLVWNIYIFIMLEYVLVWIQCTICQCISYIVTNFWSLMFWDLLIIYFSVILFCISSKYRFSNVRPKRTTLKRSYVT